MKQALILSLGVSRFGHGSGGRTRGRGRPSLPVPRPRRRRSTTTEGKTSTTERRPLLLRSRRRSPSPSVRNHLHRNRGRCKIIQHFIDYVDEKTGGAVTNPTRRYPRYQHGGVGSGRLRFCRYDLLDYPPFADQLPFLNLRPAGCADRHGLLQPPDVRESRHPSSSGELPRTTSFTWALPLAAATCSCHEPFATLADLGEGVLPALLRPSRLGSHRGAALASTRYL